MARAPKPVPDRASNLFKFHEFAAVSAPPSRGAVGVFWSGTPTAILPGEACHD